MPITLCRINTTPVKGTALQQPHTVHLDETGVFSNRRFYLIDEDGIMINGKRAGQLVQLQAHYDETQQHLTITFPDGTSLGENVRFSEQAALTNFYGRPVQGRLVDGPWNQAISDFVHKPLRLVQAERATIATDVHPVTLVSRATLGFLRNQANGPAAHWADRFRMLFELDGLEAFEEDTWRDRILAIGQATLRVLGPVPRCLVTGQDPATGERNFETLQALRTLRNWPHPALAANEAHGGKLMLGMYATVEQHGPVSVGDVVEIRG